jgi:hypothetical protein
MLLAVVGIVLNAYVISRLAQLACHDYERFKSGCGLPLAAMSGSDLLSLLSINAMVVLNQFLPASVFTPAFGDIQCKVSSGSLRIVKCARKFQLPPALSMRLIAQVRN